MLCRLAARPFPSAPPFPLGPAAPNRSRIQRRGRGSLGPRFADVGFGRRSPLAAASSCLCGPRPVAVCARPSMMLLVPCVAGAGPSSPLLVSVASRPRNAACLAGARRGRLPFLRLPRGAHRLWACAWCGSFRSRVSGLPGYRPTRAGRPYGRPTPAAIVGGCRPRPSRAAQAAKCTQCPWPPLTALLLCARHECRDDKQVNRKMRRSAARSTSGRRAWSIPAAPGLA